MTTRTDIANRVEAVLLDRPQSLRSEDLPPLIEALVDAVLDHEHTWIGLPQACGACGVWKDQPA